MKLLGTIVAMLFLFVSSAHDSLAHFGMVIPSEVTVMENERANIELNLKFWHPFENRGMDLAKPAAFDVYFDGESQSLLSSLKEGKEQGKTVWSTPYKITRPGLYAFVMQPQPYWEPEEDCFIVHYTKAYVDAFGDVEGWSEPLGLKAEIVPLSRPSALYAGNVFQGQVLFNGKPVSGAEVEIEWYPGVEMTGQAPNATMVTQTVRADNQGIFTYAAPNSGWWGFAALLEGDYKLKQGDEDKDVEVGAVLCIYFHKMQYAKVLK